METLSPSPRTRVRKKARIRLSARVAWNSPTSRAQTVPLVIVARSYGKR
jgi:hypothetical protein